MSDDNSDESGEWMRRLSSSRTMFSEYRIRRGEFFAGPATAIVSETGLTIGCLTRSFNLAFLAGGSPAGGVVDSTLGKTGTEDAVSLIARRRLAVPLDMPRSVASLYFLILADDMREVKWKTETWGLGGAMLQST